MTPALWLLVLLGTLLGLLFFAPWLRLHWHMALARRSARRLDRVAGEVFGVDRLPAVEPTWYPPTPPQDPSCGVELYGRVSCAQCRAARPPAIDEPPYDSAGLSDEERAAEAVRIEPCSRYRYLASSPFRTDDEEREVRALREELRRQDAHVAVEPCEREGT